MRRLNTRFYAAQMAPVHASVNQNSTGRVKCDVVYRDGGGLGCAAADEIATPEFCLEVTVVSRIDACCVLVDDHTSCSSGNALLLGCFFGPQLVSLLHEALFYVQDVLSPTRQQYRPP
jgi:hypothetical protein